jgi:CRP/FNR family cyclic AMP-dependent transcriptional regulator
VAYGCSFQVIAMIEAGARQVDFRILKDVKSHEASYSAGAEILTPGRISRMMYIVKSGVVAVQLGNVTVEQVREGNIFGEMGIVDPQPHTARVVALTDVHLFGITEQQFLQLIGSNPSFALRVMRVMARRTRAMNAKLTEPV